MRVERRYYGVNICRNILICLTLLSACLPCRAQTDPNLTQYFQSPTFFNPASAGHTDLLRIRVGSRLQWLGIEGAPRDFMATGDIPFKLINRRWGAGAVLMQESIGLYRTLSVGAQLSARQKVGKGLLSLGVQVSYLNQQFKGSEVYIPDDDDFHQSNDEAIPNTDVTGQGVDLGLGVAFSHKWVDLGVSCTHLLQPTLKLRREGDNGTASSEGQDFEFTFPRTLYFTAQSNIPIKNTLFEVLPSVMLRSDLHTVQANVTARVRWHKFLTVGLAYRTQDAVSLLLEGEIKGFTLAYSYDYATSAIMRASSGSHEVWVGYSLKLNFGEKNRNKHKSIRLM